MSLCFDARSTFNSSPPQVNNSVVKLVAKCIVLVCFNVLKFIKRLSCAVCALVFSLIKSFFVPRTGSTQVKNVLTVRFKNAKFFLCETDHVKLCDELRIFTLFAKLLEALKYNFYCIKITKITIIYFWKHTFK
jgi:hypothetical protein